MGKVYQYPNEYAVDCGEWGNIEVSAHSHSEAKYLAYVAFRNAYGAWVYEDWGKAFPNCKKCTVTLLWFCSKVVRSVRMTIKSVLNY